MTKETYTVMSYQELDTLVQTHYQKPNFECVAAGDWNNGAAYVFTVKRQPLDNYSEGLMQKFLTTGNIDWGIWTLLNDLCNQKVIEPGNYLITVYW